MCKGKIKRLVNKNVSKVVVCNIIDSNDIIDEYENDDALRTITEKIIKKDCFGSPFY